MICRIFLGLIPRDSMLTDSHSPISSGKGKCHSSRKPLVRSPEAECENQTLRRSWGTLGPNIDSAIERSSKVLKICSLRPILEDFDPGTRSPNTEAKLLKCLKRAEVERQIWQHQAGARIISGSPVMFVQVFPIVQLPLDLTSSPRAPSPQTFDGPRPRSEGTVGTQAAFRSKLVAVRRGTPPSAGTPVN